MAIADGRTRTGRARKDAANDWNDLVHTGPGTLAGRYFRRFWHPIYRADDLAVEWPMPLTIMGEELTLYRAQDGSPHLLAARCAHRGMLLHVGWVEDDCIRCFFHGWKYDASGQCVDQPGEDESFKDKIRIRSYPVRDYLGIIFAYLGEDESPPFPRYPDFEREGVLEVSTYGEDCNWLQHIEDNPVHSLFVHGGRRRVPKPPPRVWVEETDWGHAAFAEYPGYPGVRVHHRGMPNIAHVVNDPIDEESGYRPHLSWTVPVDDEHLVNFGVDHIGVTGEAADRFRERRAAWRARGGRTYDAGLVQAVLAGKLRIEEVRKRTDLDIGRVEDSIAYLGIGAIADRSREHLGRADASTIIFRKIWSRELRALAVRRPLKQWVRTEGCVATPQTVPWQKREQ